MATHDDEIVKHVLHKLIDDMDSLEANRIHPRPVAQPGVSQPTEDKGETFDEAEPENQENQHDHSLDPHILSELMDKAGSAREDGSLPEDDENDLPEEIAVAVKKKKASRPA